MSSSDEEFFRTPKAAAIFKHAVLDQYLKPYAMKTGLRPPHRVAFVDGYAGPGLYDDGSPGSPARVLQTAVDIADRRKLECHFIEQKDLFLDALREFVSRQTGSAVARVYDGDVNEHLDDLINQTKEVPTLVFLDPFGLVIPFESVRRILRRPTGPGNPGVEVLINFSTVSLRRIAGMLTSDKAVPATLARMDEVCGGDWWRALWMSHLPDSAKAEEAVAVEYANRLAGKGPGSYGWWTVDVRNRPNHLPVYYLVFLTRHRDGLSLFGESASLALQKWREKIFADDNTEYTLFGSTEDDFKASEEALASGWVNHIVENLRALLSERQAFSIADNYLRIFGEALGKAREKHLRVAWNLLYAAGETSTNPRGKKILKMWMMPPQ